MGGAGRSLVIDRVTASRFGIAPSTIDNTLYDAFGQRQINTMYTQVNQSTLFSKASRSFQLDPNKLTIFTSSRMRPRVPEELGASPHSRLPDHLPPGRMRSLVLPSTLRRQYAYSSANALSPTTPSTSNNGSNFCGRHQFLHEQCGTLSAFSHFEKTTEALSINHRGNFRRSPYRSIWRRMPRWRGDYGGRQSRKRLAHAAQPAGWFSRHRGIIHKFAVQ